jgi:hypothetical protein
MVGSYCGSKLRQASNICPSVATLSGGHWPSWAAARQQQVFADHGYVMHNMTITMAGKDFYFDNSRNVRAVILRDVSFICEI